MFKWTPIHQLKAKIYFNLESWPLMDERIEGTGLPGVVALGPELLIFEGDFPQVAREAIKNLTLYLNVLGKWKDYQLTLLPQPASAFQESLFGQLKQVAQNPCPLFFAMSDEQKASFKMDLNLARSR